MAPEPDTLFLTESHPKVIALQEFSALSVVRPVPAGPSPANPASCHGRYQQNDGGLTSARIHPASYVIAPCDYAIVIRFTPLSARRTLQEILWLVSPNAREGTDYERDRITWLWQVTTDQDQQIIEANQQGVESRVYTPGPYATVEDTVNRFVVWYLREVTG